MTASDVNLELVPGLGQIQLLNICIDQVSVIGVPEKVSIDITRKQHISTR